MATARCWSARSGALDLLCARRSHRSAGTTGDPTMKIRRPEDGELDLLLNIWLRSVRATHRFLTDPDVQALLPVVRDHALPEMRELWVLCTEDSEPIGFMGLSDDSVDALFIAPEHLRRGGGRMLIEHARRLKGSLRVDVNEQNPEAIRFYAATGFQVIGRSAVDGDGRPFPLIHMRSDRPARTSCIE